MKCERKTHTYTHKKKTCDAVLVTKQGHVAQFVHESFGGGLYQKFALGIDRMIDSLIIGLQSKMIHIHDAFFGEWFRTVIEVDRQAVHVLRHKDVSLQFNEKATNFIREVVHQHAVASRHNQIAFQFRIVGRRQFIQTILVAQSVRGIEDALFADFVDGQIALCFGFHEGFAGAQRLHLSEFLGVFDVVVTQNARALQETHHMDSKCVIDHATAAMHQIRDENHVIGIVDIRPREGDVVVQGELNVLRAIVNVVDIVVAAASGGSRTRIDLSHQGARPRGVIHRITVETRVGGHIHEIGAHDAQATNGGRGGGKRGGGPIGEPIGIYCIGTIHIDKGKVFVDGQIPFGGRCDGSRESANVGRVGGNIGVGQIRRIEGTIRVDGIQGIA